MVRARRVKSIELNTGTDLKPIDGRMLSRLRGRKVSDIPIATLDGKVDLPDASLGAPIAGNNFNGSLVNDLSTEFAQKSSLGSNPTSGSLWSRFKEGVGRVTGNIVPLGLGATGIIGLIASGGDASVSRFVILSGLALLGIAGPTILQNTGFGGFGGWALSFGPMKTTLYGLSKGLKANFNVQIPNATTGIEGMKRAHKILRERNAVGILIGSMAEAVWDIEMSPEELSSKDVSVMVVTKGFEPREPFEGGIDWCLRRSRRVWEPEGWYEPRTYIEVDKPWWENGNDDILAFGVTQTRYLEPGLYIPSSDWVIRMRRVEAEAWQDYGVAIRDEYESYFEATMRRKVGVVVAVPVHLEFEGYILDDIYSPITGEGSEYSFVLYRVNLDTRRKINDHLGRVTRDD